MEGVPRGGVTAGGRGAATAAHRLTAAAGEGRPAAAPSRAAPSRAAAAPEGGTVPQRRGACGNVPGGAVPGVQCPGLQLSDGGGARDGAPVDCSTPWAGGASSSRVWV